MWLKIVKNTVVKNTGVCLGIYSTSYHHRLKCFKLSTFGHMKCEKKIQCQGLFRSSSQKGSKQKAIHSKTVEYVVSNLQESQI